LQKSSDGDGASIKRQQMGESNVGKYQSRTALPNGDISRGAGGRPKPKYLCLKRASGTDKRLCNGL